MNDREYQHAEAEMRRLEAAVAAAVEDPNPPYANRERCQLDPMLVVGLVMMGQNPCDGCNHDRAECGGTAKR